MSRILLLFVLGLSLLGTVLGQAKLCQHGDPDCSPIDGGSLFAPIFVFVLLPFLALYGVSIYCSAKKGILTRVCCCRSS